MAETAWFASELARHLLCDNGISTLEEAFSVGQPLEGSRRRLGSRHKHKEVVRVELFREGVAEAVFIKRQWRRDRWVPRPVDVLRGMAFHSVPFCEWRGLNALRAIGVDAAEPLALFQTRWSIRSAVVTRAVIGASSLAEVLRGETALDPDDLPELSASVLAVIRRIQDSGYAWLSMKAKHFYPLLTLNGRFAISVIDCEGVYPGATLRERSRDYAGFVNSLPKTDAAGRFLAALVELDQQPAVVKLNPVFTRKAA